METSATHMGDLTVAWLSPDSCSRLGSGLADGRPISVSPSLKLWLLTLNATGINAACTITTMFLDIIYLHTDLHMWIFKTNQKQQEGCVKGYAQWHISRHFHWKWSKRVWHVKFSYCQLLESHNKNYKRNAMQASKMEYNCLKNPQQWKQWKPRWHLRE